jgi:2-polyprenyl-3-methyl-5-hydroxy-6-metoxy-1,4-benzoquinol methylase
VSAAPATTPKPPGYYSLGRQDLLDLLPRPVGRVLDIGCGEGGVGRILRDEGADAIWGIEIVPDAAARASQVYDRVVIGSAEDALTNGEVEGRFDTIICYDVLEHLADPQLVLALLRERAAPEARLHVSVPNARYLGLAFDLVVRGTFGYADWGHRDNTHLRWFTRRDLEAAVRHAGWQVRSSRPNPFHGRDEPFNRATRGRLAEFIAIQWNVVAVANGR